MTTAYCGEIAVSKTSPILADIAQRLEVLNEKQSSILFDIGQKMHAVLDRRTPTTGAVESRENRRDAPDFASTMGDHLMRLEDNTKTLRALLDHLSELV